MTDDPTGRPDPLAARRPRWWEGISRPNRRRILWGALAAAGVILLFLLPRVVAFVALAAMLVGIVAWARDIPTLFRLKSKPARVGVTFGSAAVLLVALVVGSAGAPSQNAPSGTAGVALLSDSAETEADVAQSTFRMERVVEPIPFSEVTVDDPNLVSGSTQVVTPGQVGERTLTYRIEYLEGREVGRELISTAVTVEPVDQVTAIGSYVAPAPEPAPPPAASGCDPNYAEACVPIASDVDCAWGSGNGPAYFDGVARVVGIDIYELDRDGDGYACEQ